ncbi:hypothetical protein NQ314_014441 [Rhamnusium bicolor]|uniref:Arrestin-like N-terminal domain-containing protein n=1 Tax=Rhamnusium bicolor TaxID=1586634 RepID=A0AAV8X1Y6_9CUCU|nr:hypothetical protein NQ314_014441 [Rhamnusium bicolor]
MSQCKVWLDNYSGQYYPGAQIQGKVVLNLDGDTKLRGVKVKIICHEHTEWLGTESYYEDNEQKSRDTLFKGDNDAFATELILYGGQSGTTSLPVGQHIYPFNLNLPNNLPATFHGEHGSVSYKLIATVDRPMALDYEDQLIFVVLAPVNLNLLQQPDLLIITCLVDDPSKEERVQNNILVELNEVGLGAHGEHTYTFSVMLPMNVPIPNFSQCKLFKVQYVYKVDLEILMYPEVGNIEINQAGGHPGGFSIPATAGEFIPGYPYPEGPGTQYPPPVGGVPVYPRLLPSAPPSGFDPKAQEISGIPNRNENPHPDQPPPSYDSLNMN